MLRAAMDYYEELGVPRTAPVEDIRRAWRNLARLLHPDQQQDENLRFLAEKQMTRLNEVCAVLTDPVQRLRYDLSLFGAPPWVPAAGWRSDPRGRWLLAAVLALCAIAAGAFYPRPAPPRTLPREPASVTVTQHAATPTPAARRRAVHRDGPVPLPRRQEPPPAVTAPAPIGLPPEIAGIDPVPALPVALPAATAVPQSTPEPVSGVAGAWFYAPQKTPQGGAALYSPEFIEVFIAETAGAVQGRYWARYKVGDRPISGNVQFSFEGRPQGDPIVLPWTGSGGRSGQVRLKVLADGTLQVSWHATQFGYSTELASGTAILTRRRGL